MTEQLNLWKAALEVAFDQTCSVGRPKDWKLIKDALDSVNAALTHPAPPASQEQAQQPSAQAWANETGLRQIECPSCGDLAVAYDPQQPSGGEVVAWRDPSNSDPGQGCTYDKAVHEKWPHIYRQPLCVATPKPEPMTWQPIETAPKGHAVLLWLTRGGARCVIDDWGDYDRYNHPRITHWMPLPPAPITKGEA